MTNMEKLTKIFEDKETVAAMNACTTMEEVLAALKDKGLEITAEELKELMAAVSGANKDKTGVREQTDDELEAVAGGVKFHVIWEKVGNLIDFVMPDTNKVVEDYLKNTPEPYDFNRINDI